MGKTEVVIIAHNEGEHVERMVSSIPQGWTVHYIADRCTDGTLATLVNLPNKPDVTVTFGREGRQTSYCRNLGLSLCGEDSDVLFLDGDRYPIEGDLSEAVEACKSDILLFRVEDDFRTADNFKANYGKVYNGFFSCGLWMSRKAIDAVREFQRGELFRIDMQECWGIEDTYLGDVCFSLGLTAELCGTVTLRGRFDRNTVDSLDVIERRLNERDKLKNVIW